MQILVADDDITSRIAVRRKLMQLGYDVVMASDGPEALAGLLAPGAPALAILDWVMPGMEGTEVCRRIRAARAG
ncbi:MAG: response regulator, partial [Myxococcales bacterium]